jgi:hypothetical protein
MRESYNLECSPESSEREGAEMNIAFLIGRIIFATFWLMGSFNHFKNLNYMSEYAKARGNRGGAGAMLCATLVKAGLQERY